MAETIDYSLVEENSIGQHEIFQYLIRGPRYAARISHELLLIARRISAPE
jgi:hypothetical protein